MKFGYSAHENGHEAYMPATRETKDNRGGAMAAAADDVGSYNPRAKMAVDAVHTILTLNLNQIRFVNKRVRFHLMGKDAGTTRPKQLRREW